MEVDLRVAHGRSTELAKQVTAKRQDEFDVHRRESTTQKGEVHELKRQLDESHAKIEDLETQMAEDNSRCAADDAALGNFFYISANANVLWAMLHRQASADILMLLKDFQAYVAECPPEADIILHVANLADFGVDLAFLGPASRLTRPRESADPTQATSNEPVVPEKI